MKKSFYRLLVLVLIFNISSCKEEKQVKEEVLRPVKYEIVGPYNAQNIRTFSGKAKASDAIALSFRSNGVITEINYFKGAKVKKGATIAKLDNVEANLSYQQAISSVNAAQSALNTSKSNLDRVKLLYEKGNNSLSDYEQAKNSYQSALDQYESAKRNRSIQQTQISYGIIKAPKDGVIVWTDGAVNERVSAGHQFAELNAGKGMKIEIGIPEAIINQVSVDMEVDVEFSAIEDEKFEGRVFEVSPSIDPNSSTYITAVQIIDPTPDIKAGMASSVTFDLSEDSEISDEVLVVPVKAVGEDGKGNFVFIIETQDGQTGVVKKKQIEISELTSHGFKVKSGLNKGDKIATAGLQTLIDGQKIRLQ